MIDRWHMIKEDPAKKEAYLARKRDEAARRRAAMTPEERAAEDERRRKAQAERRAANPEHRVEINRRASEKRLAKRAGLTVEEWRRRRDEKKTKVAETSVARLDAFKREAHPKKPTRVHSDRVDEVERSIAERLLSACANKPIRRITSADIRRPRITIRGDDVFDGSEPLSSRKWDQRVPDMLDLLPTSGEWIPSSVISDALGITREMVCKIASRAERSIIRADERLFDRRELGRPNTNETSYRRHPSLCYQEAM